MRSMIMKQFSFFFHHKLNLHHRRKVNFFLRLTTIYNPIFGSVEMLDNFSLCYADSVGERLEVETNMRALEVGCGKGHKSSWIKTISLFSSERERVSSFALWFWLHSSVELARSRAPALDLKCEQGRDNEENLIPSRAHVREIIFPFFVVNSIRFGIFFLFLSRIIIFPPQHRKRAL